MSETLKRLLWPEAAVWVALLALLAVTFAAARLPLGQFGMPVNLSIAAMKALLVAVFFMHLRRAGGLVRLASLLGLAWLVILLALACADYLTR